jgi:hypothetical protein
MNRTPSQAVGLQFDYQTDTDLLFAWTGAPERALNVEVEPGLYVRVTPDRDRVLGIEVLDCAARFGLDPAMIDSACVQGLLERFTSEALQIARSTSTAQLPFASQQ